MSTSFVVRGLRSSHGRAVWGLALGLWACGPETLRFAAEVRSGELAAFVVMGADRTVELAGWVGERSEVEVSDPEVAVVTFAFPRDRLVDLDGLPLGQQILDATRVRGLADSASEGSCGRCVAHDRANRLLALAGSSCPPPEFARTEVQGDRARAEGARDLVRLDFPGDCACGRLEVGPERPTLSLEPAPGFDWTFSKLSETVGGFGVFGEHVSRRVSDEGFEVRMNEPTFPGPIAAAAGTPEGGFVVIARDVSRAEGFHTQVLSADLTVQSEISGPDARVLGLLHSALPDRYVMATEGPTGVPRMLVCNQPASEWDCGELTPRGLELPVGREVARLSWTSRPLALYSPQWMLVFDRAPGTNGPFETVFTSPARGELRGSDGERVRFLFEVVPNPSQQEVDTIYLALSSTVAALCLQLGGADPSARTLVAPIDFERPMNWQELDVRQGRCGGIYFHPDGRFTTYLGGELIDCSLDGCSAPITYRDLAISDPPEALRQAQSGRVLAHTQSTVFLKGTDGNFSRALGDEYLGVFVHAAERHGVALGLTAGGLLIQAGDPVSVRSLSPFRQIHAVVDDTSTGGFLVAARVAAAWSLFHLSWPELEAQEVPGLATEGASYWELAELAPGRFVVTKDESIFVVHQDQVVDVFIEWDDPATPEIEERPDKCDRLFNHASGASGGAFVSGCNGLVLSVDGYSDPPVARRLSPVGGSMTSAADLRAGYTQCPDDAFFLLRGLGFTDDEYGRLWRIGADRRLVEDPINARAQTAAGLASGPPSVLSRVGSDLVASIGPVIFRVGSNGITRLDGGGIKSISAAAHGSGVVGTEHGQLYLIHSAE
ncbi:MAG: hypothetical protein HY791_38485 [Deltaproteobacteria bacterium]|nr:hypothetical protein [Deltaproteobacteria bacterium]